MTRNFCDICGEPAYSGTVSFNKRLPGKAWSGTRCNSNSPNPVDGSWTPRLDVVAHFYITDLESKPEQHTPDLCIGCVYVMLADQLLQLRLKMPAQEAPTNPIDEATAQGLIAELLEALREVVRISDRKHEAWDRAKAVIAKAGMSIL